MDPWNFDSGRLTQFILALCGAVVILAKTGLMLTKVIGEAWRHEIREWHELNTELSGSHSVDTSDIKGKHETEIVQADDDPATDP